MILNTLLSKFLNPFWITQETQLNMAGLSGMLGGALGGASTGASFGGPGALIGGVVGGLGGLFGSEDEVKQPTPEELAQQTVGIRENIFLPALTRMRGQFNPQLAQQGIDQTNRIQQGLSGVNRNIASDIGQQRNMLGVSDADFLRSQSQGFAGSERLQAILQKQAEEELALGGQLSDEDLRNVQQGSQAASFSRGRGTGSFGIGQLALARQGATDARKAQRRNFAGQTIQSGLNVSNPLQRILAQNTQTAGSMLDRLRNSQQFGQQNQVQSFDPISGAVSGISGFNTSNQQGFNQRQSERSDDIFGGALSALGSLGGGGGFGGGGSGGMSSFGGLLGGFNDPSTGGVQNVFGRPLQQGPRLR